MSSGELGAFLKARRLELTPEVVGLPERTGRRRINGLRREEVAFLASISTDFYTRLEQGRRRASEPVLDSLARVLRLSQDERRYLFELSGKEDVRPRRRSLPKVQPPLQRLLDDLGSTPAIVVTRCTDILAWNPLYAALFTDFSVIPPRERNHVRLNFLHPQMRALYQDWEEVGLACVAQLRMEAARDPKNPRLADLVGELSVRDADFAGWWGSHHVAARDRGIKRLRHPIAGELTLDWSTLISATDADQQLVTLSAEPGSPSHDGLRILASWQAEIRAKA